MPNVRRWPFVRCFADAAVVFREGVAAALESGALFDNAPTLALLREAHERNRRRDLLYRLLDRRSLLPLTAFLELCQEASDEIARHGFFHGCRREVERFRIALEVTVSDPARRLFESGAPILFTGSHPCLWGPDLWAVAAALDTLCPGRRDFLFLTWTLVTALCPALGPYSAPVVVTSRDFDRFTHDERHVADDRPMGAEALFREFTPDVPVPASRRANYQALRRMARHWLDGGHALIFPTGGAGTRALWFSGIGRVARFASEMLDGHAPDPHIVFFRLEGAHDFLMLAPPLLAPWHPARLLALGRRRRIAIHFDQVLRLHDWRERFLGMTNRAVARFLQKEFESGSRGS